MPSPESARLVAAVGRVFSAGGPLPRVLPGFEARQGQVEMAEAVAGVMADGGVLLAEAGTGTGKTLAYLVPAILSRQRVLVSTGTKNLQDQIFDKDLPVLRRALDVPFTAAYMKGRSNYLCLHRFDEVRGDRSARALVGEFIRIVERWARVTETGDRAEVAELPEDLPFWSDISASAENCLGTGCPRYDDCFVTKMRRTAAESDIIVVNHHLLCADASVRQSAYGEVIPDCAFAVLDEAHQIEDVATQYFGLSVSTFRVEQLARDTDRLVATAALEDDHGSWRGAVDRLRDHATGFFLGLSMALQRRSSEFGGDERVRIRPDGLADLHDEAQGLLDGLDQLEGQVSLSRAVSEDVQGIGRRAGELRDQLRFLLRASDPDYVYFVESRGRGLFLRAAPIDVSAIVREMLLDRMQATVLTSATLSVGGSFEYVRGRLGIGRAVEVRLASEFDYARQTILYLPPRLPDPQSPGFVEAAGREIIEILKRSRGRAFVLFTSYAVLRRVQGLVEAGLPYPILVQGSAPRSTLLQRFRATPNAVLLATSSFWQGVDVVGDALSCVIVDKLPFASPGDPITAARIEAISARGGEPFNEFQVPLAILTLQQGLGRLIRHRRDRGALAVLDPRLRTRGYGAQFLQALPPSPVTTDLADLERFFADAPGG